MNQIDNTISKFESQYLKTNVSLMSFKKMIDEIVVFNEKQITNNNEENDRILIEEYNKLIQSNKEIEMQVMATREHLEELIKIVDNVNQFIVGERNKIITKCGESIEGLIKSVKEKRDNEIKQLEEQINEIEKGYDTKIAEYEREKWCFTIKNPIISSNTPGFGGFEHKSFNPFNLFNPFNPLKSNNQTDLNSNAKSIPFDSSKLFGDPQQHTESIEKKEDLKPSDLTVCDNGFISDGGKQNEAKLGVDPQNEIVDHKSQQIQDEIKDEKQLEKKDQNSLPPFIFDWPFNFPIMQTAFSSISEQPLQEQTNEKQESQQYESSVGSQFTFDPFHPLIVSITTMEKMIDNGSQLNDVQQPMVQSPQKDVQPQQPMAQWSQQNVPQQDANVQNQQSLGSIVQSTEQKSRERSLEEDSESEEYSESEEDICFEPMARLQEVEQKEPKENIIFKDRCRCSIFDNESKEFKERGIGEIGIIKNPETGLSRVVLIRDQILELACDHYCSPYIEIKEIPKEEKLLTYTVREDYAQEHRNQITFEMVFNSKEIRDNFRQVFTNAQLEVQKLDQN